MYKQKYKQQCAHKIPVEVSMSYNLKGSRYISLNVTKLCKDEKYTIMMM